MPFTAECRPSTEAGGWQWVTALGRTLEELTELRATHSLRCPDPLCHAQLFVRMPAAARPHFYHRPNEGSEGCLLRGGESPLHIEAKAAVAEWVQRQARYRGSRVALEHILEAGEARRVADVLVQLPGGEVHVLECQASYQTVEEYVARTRDYYRLGADHVLWFCNLEHLRGPLAEWARQQWEIGYLEIKDEVIAVS